MRATACRVLNAVLHQGKSLDDALAWALQRQRMAPRDTALLKALCFGVLRHYRRLGWQAQQLMERPVRDAPLVDLLLRVGLFQLLDLRVPDHAATSATASAADRLDAAWARPLVNAVLRRALREPERLEPPAEPELRHSWPDWLAAAFQRDWGEAADALLEQANVQAPMTLRVNRRRMPAADYRARLAARGVTARPVRSQGDPDPGDVVTLAPDAVVLAEPMDVQALPGFARGSVSVQDASAQLAVELLALDEPAVAAGRQGASAGGPSQADKAGDKAAGADATPQASPALRVLDACSAPGGKAAHILERCPSADLTALDSDRARIKRVDETLRRIGAKAELICADAADTARWHRGEAFDRILVDAPCSGTGVIRRHPDIKWLRRESDIAALAEQQGRLLEALWPLLAPGGRLVFATCSMLRAEGAEVVEAFLQRRPQARVVDVCLPVGAADGPGWRIPAGGDWDGFFYAVLTTS